MGVGHTHPGAGQPIKHPGGNLKPPVCIATAEITAEINAVRLRDSFMNADPETKPQMHCSLRKLVTVSGRSGATTV